MFSVQNEMNLGLNEQKNLSLGILKNILISVGLNMKWKANVFDSSDTNYMA